jgi:galactokinase
LNDPFATTFGRAPEVSAAAPGRVNLIGEHVDCHGGHVLPVPLPLFTRVELAARNDREVRCASDSVPESAPLSYHLDAPARGRGWIDYVQGVTAALTAEGVRLPAGFELYVRSDVPLGSGLSSSAALEVAVLRALRERFALALTDVDLARLGQAAETRFVGAQIGIMDQMAASVGQQRTALFLDTRTLAFEQVALPEALEVVVLDSGVRHGHAGGEYNSRRQECEAAARALGVALLCDLGEDALPRIDRLPGLLSRRARHVVTEEVRVKAFVAALREGDLPALGPLLARAHASLRDDYQVSIPLIDALVAEAVRTPGVLGARLTGGGFGGAVVVLAERGSGAAAGQQIAAAFASAPSHPRVLATLTAR